MTYYISQLATATKKIEKEQLYVNIWRGIYFFTSVFVRLWKNSSIIKYGVIFSSNRHFKDFRIPHSNFYFSSSFNDVEIES